MTNVDYVATPCGNKKKSLNDFVQGILNIDNRLYFVFVLNGNQTLSNLLQCLMFVYMSRVCSNASNW